MELTFLYQREKASSKANNFLALDVLIELVMMNLIFRVAFVNSFMML